MNDSKAIVFIEPISPTMKELYEILLPESGGGAEFELYRPTTALEVSQVLPQLGPALIITADHKICALTLTQNKLIIKGLKSKVIIINSKKLPTKILDKFHKSGLTDYFLEPIAIKTLTYKVKLLVKSLPVIGKEKEFINKLKVSEDKKEQETEGSTLIKEREQKSRDFFERRQQELESKKILDENQKRIKESQSPSPLPKKDDSTFVQSDADELTRLKREEEKTEKTREDSATHISTYKEQPLQDLKGKIANQNPERLQGTMKGESHYKEKDSGQLRGDVQYKEPESSALKGKTSFKEKTIAPLSGKIQSTDVVNTEPLKAETKFKEELGGHYHGDQDTYHDAALGKEVHPQNSDHTPDTNSSEYLKAKGGNSEKNLSTSQLSKRKKVKLNEDDEDEEKEIEIEYVYEMEENRSPHEGSVDHLNQKMVGKAASSQQVTNPLSGVPSNKKAEEGPYLGNIKNKQNGEGKKLSPPSLRSKVESPLLEGKMNESTLATPELTSHEAQVDHIEKYYGLKTKGDQAPKNSSFIPFQSALNSKENKANRTLKKIEAHDKGMLQFGSLAEGKGQVNYGQIYSEFQDIDQDKNATTQMDLQDVLQMKKVQTLLALINYHHDLKSLRFDTTSLLKRFHKSINSIYALEFSLQIKKENLYCEIYHTLRGRKTTPQVLEEFIREKNILEKNDHAKVLEYFDKKVTLIHGPLIFQIFFYKQTHLPPQNWLNVFKNIKGAA